MGIIRRQSFFSSIYIYLGFAIGAVNTLILFPNQHFFKPEEFGLTRLLLDASLVIATLCTLGSSPAVIKFFPFYNSYLEKKHNDLPALAIISVCLGCTALLCFGPFFENIVIRKFSERSPLFINYYYLIYPLSITMAFMYVFESFSWSLKNTVLPIFLREVFLRILTTIIILLLFIKVITFSQFIILYAFMYLPVALVLLTSLIRSGRFVLHFKLSSVTRRLKGRIITFSLFIFSGQVLNVLARTIDGIIIASQSKGGLIDTAVFTIATYLIALMEVPIRSMTGIAGVVIAQSWKDKDMKRIESIYKKTALNFLLLGMAIFGLILLNIHNMISFLGPVYGPMSELVVILGASKLVDLGTGFNSQILLSSKYWKIDFVTNILLVLLSCVLNYLLVRSMGIIGSSYANLISFTIYNFIRFIFIKKFFGMQPFGIANIKILLIGGICFLVTWVIPFVINIYIDSVIRSFVFVFIYGFIVLKLRISDDVNEFVKIIAANIKSNLRWRQ